MSTNSVSVVMPVHNGQQFIRQSIQSALDQVGCEVELIVVDDGSTDNTAQIVRSFGARVRYVFQANAGPAAARNAGIEFAQHEWIAFLDADDLWTSDKLSRQLKLAQDIDAQLVYSNTKNFGSDDVDELRSVPDEMPAGDVYHHLLLDNFVTLSSVLIRRETLISVDGFRTSYRGTEDWDLWLRLSSAGVEFHPIREPLVQYRWLDNSLSKSHRRMKELREQTLNAALSRRASNWVTRRRARANVLATSAWFCQKSSPRLSQRWYWAAVVQWPLSMNTWKSLLAASLRRLTPMPSRPAITNREFLPIVGAADSRA